MKTTARPQTLDELIGQEALKQKARIAIGAALQRGEPLPHAMLTSAGGGLGKTSFAGILANEMFSMLTHTTGQCLVNAADLRKVLIGLKPGSLLHVDGTSIATPVGGHCGGPAHRHADGGVTTSPGCATGCTGIAP